MKCLIFAALSGCLLVFQSHLSFSVNLFLSLQLMSASRRLHDPSRVQTRHKCSDAAQPFRTFLSMKASAESLPFFFPPSIMHVWTVACGQPHQKQLLMSLVCSETVCNDFIQLFSTARPPGQRDCPHWYCSWRQSHRRCHQPAFLQLSGKLDQFASAKRNP